MKSSLTFGPDLLSLRASSLERESRGGRKDRTDLPIPEHTNHLQLRSANGYDDEDDNDGDGPSGPASSI